MQAIRRIEFKVYPTRVQLEQLENWNTLHARLYNACLEQRIWAYKSSKKSISYYEQQNELPKLKLELPEYKQLGSHALQETVRRVDRAFKAFFSRVKKSKESCGFPRFKSAKRFAGFCYPDKAGWKFELGTTGKHGNLTISNLGALKVRGKPRDWGTPTTLTLSRKADGQWYASITINCFPKRETGVEAVGMDLGVENAVILSNGVTVANPRHLNRSLSSLAQLQRKRARQARVARKVLSVEQEKRYSKNYQKTTKTIQKLHEKVKNQRKDFLHKTTSNLIKNYNFIATETLSIKNMTTNGGSRKRGLNRAMLDVGMGMFLQMLLYKAEEAGTKLVEVPTRTVKPSQTCPCCGKQEKKLLSTRVHKCGCGYTASRDVAAAKVMLLWAQARTAREVLSCEQEGKLPITATDVCAPTSGAGVLARTMDDHGSMTQETAPIIPSGFGAQ
jgi:putative transposase